MSYTFLQDHRGMAFDKVRNRAYEKAIKSLLAPDAVVLDLGAGVGVLGFLAAQHGARRVYLCEPSDVILAAETIARANPWADRIVCHQGAIEEIALPEQADMILSVFTGNFLLEEDLLPSLFYARDRYLKPGGVLLPSRGRMCAVPVYAPDLYQRDIGIWSADYLGIDFSCVRRYAANALSYDTAALSQAAFLAEPRALLELDFYTCQDASCQTEVTFGLTETGLCHGLAGWFDMKLGDDWLSTNPQAERMHWNAVLLPLDPPLQVKAGEEMTFRLSRPAFGEWSWWVQAGSLTQQHSTAFAGPYNRAQLLKSATGYQPMLGPRGQAWQSLLAKFDGQTSLEEMADFLLAAYPALFRTRAQAFQLINNFVRQCA